MNKILYFSIGVFLAFCLFWPAVGHAGNVTIGSHPFCWRSAAGTWSNSAATGIYQWYTSINPDGYRYAQTENSFASNYTTGYFKLPASATYGTNACRDYATANSIGAAHYFTYSEWMAGQGVPAPTYNYPVPTEPPPPPEPAHCSNTTKDGDETGVNCGGSCLASCSKYCPIGYELGLIIGGGYECSKAIDPDQFGNCPAGWLQMGTFCKSVADPIDAADPQLLTEPVLTSSGWYQLPAEYTPGTFNVVNMSSFDTVDNQDGTHTVTETKTTSGPGSSTSTTITSNTYNTTTGQLVGSTSTTTGETSPEENPGNYNYSVSDTESDGLIPSGILPEEQSFSGFLDSTISNNPGLAIIGNSGLETSSAACSISGQIMGQTFSISFCDPLYSDALSALGALLVSFCYLLAIFLIFL